MLWFLSISQTCDFKSAIDRRLIADRSPILNRSCRQPPTWYVTHAILLAIVLRFLIYSDRNLNEKKNDCKLFESVFENSYACYVKLSLTSIKLIYKMHIHKRITNMIF